MSKKFECRCAPTVPRYNVDLPTEPTQKIKDLIVKVQQKLICECIVTINFVNHCYIIMLDIINHYTNTYIS